MASTLYQKWFLKTLFFVKKLKISGSLDHTNLLKFYLTIIDKVLTPFWKTFLLWLKKLFDAKILI